MSLKMVAADGFHIADVQIFGQKEILNKLHQSQTSPFKHYFTSTLFTEYKN